MSTTWRKRWRRELVSERSSEQVSKFAHRLWDSYKSSEVRVGPGEVILSFGQVVPPAILPGTPEQQAEQLAEHEYLPVRTVARLGLNRARLEELVGMLQQTLANYDQAHQAMEEEGL